jgi:SH3-like domain-containing protein
MVDTDWAWVWKTFLAASCHLVHGAVRAPALRTTESNVNYRQIPAKKHAVLATAHPGAVHIQEHGRPQSPPIEPPADFPAR